MFVLYIASKKSHRKELSKFAQNIQFHKNSLIYSHLKFLLLP